MSGVDSEGSFDGDSCSARSRSVELPRPTLFIADPNGLYSSCSISSFPPNHKPHGRHYSGPACGGQGLS